MSSDFLDMQAAIGVSKHSGGLPAARALGGLCHVAGAAEALDVGCGIGVEPARIASTTSARVVGLDLSDRMLAWADRRARGAGVRDRVELVQGNVLALPFADDRFDAVLCESVLAFVEDKELAIAEMVRVTRPGGWVGLNEAFLRTETPPPRLAQLARSLGTDLVTLERWRALWVGSGLEERAIRTYRADPGRELRDRIRWIGLPWMLRAWGRVARVYLTDPGMRLVMKEMLGATVDKVEEDDGANGGAAEATPAWIAFGYGLFVGRKPG
jgi:SAM-dependent methyltransferase